MRHKLYLLTFIILFVCKIYGQEKSTPSTFKSGESGVKYLTCRNVLPNVLAAPVNDNCTSPALIPNADLNGTCVTGYTTVGATPDSYLFGCMTGTDNVWFKFVAQGPNVEITISGGTIVDPEVALFSAGTLCSGGSVNWSYCASLAGFGGYTSISVMNQPGAFTAPNSQLVVGQTYYIMVTNAASGWPYFGSAGSFSICVNNPIPSVPGTDCSTATLLCSNTTVSGNADLWGNQELTTSTNGGCLGQYGEVNSSWYILNILTGGTLTMTISPADGTDDYDFSIWKGATCTLGTPLSCNFSAQTVNIGYGGGATGLGNGGTLTSQGAGGSPWNQQLTVASGDVYILLVNGYTPNSGNFSFTFGGTAVLGCTVPPVLPIELLFFNSECDFINGVDLKWATATETNNSYFNIEKSFDGINWTVIGNVLGSGTTSQEHYYTFTDKTLSSSTEKYYRLKQVDYNGVYTYSNITTCNSLNTDNIKIYPNPVNDNLNIMVKEDISISIYNVSGQIMSTIKLEKDKLETIDVSSYSSGLYFINIQDKNIHYKFIKK
jgi:hypothetical protein